MSTSDLDKSLIALQEILKRLNTQDDLAEVYEAIDAATDFLLTILQRDIFQRSKLDFLKRLHEEIHEPAIQRLITSLENRIDS